jgi:hypothetical protein
MTSAGRWTCSQTEVTRAEALRTSRISSTSRGRSLTTPRRIARQQCPASAISRGSYLNCPKPDFRCSGQANAPSSPRWRNGRGCRLLRPDPGGQRLPRSGVVLGRKPNRRRAMRVVGEPWVVPGALYDRTERQRPCPHLVAHGARCLFSRLPPRVVYLPSPLGRAMAARG